jgi:hypothetical protein
MADGSSITMKLRDAAGRIDLNMASEELLATLLRGLGLDDGDARAKAAAIADYRDADNERRPEGAERGAYASAGDAGPKNAAFEDTGEVARVLGIGRDLAHRIQPYVTIRSAQDGIDAAKADPELLGLLARAGAGPGQGTGLAGTSAAPTPLPQQFLNVSIGRNFAVSSLAETPSGARFVREAAITLYPAGELRVRRPALAARPLADSDPSPSARARDAEPRNEEDATRDYRIIEWRAGTLPQPERSPPDTSRAGPC